MDKYTKEQEIRANELAKEQEEQNEAETSVAQ